MPNDASIRAARHRPRPAAMAHGALSWSLLLSILVALGGCASGGGELADGDSIPPKIARIPDAVPKVEPLARYGNPESYVVRGTRYYPKKDARGHVERGLASWYGRQFHGRKTSSGERYDMYTMTAAHKTLPLPTYARVTNIENGRSVVVRINDRGPFHGSRVLDLSYVAAVKLGVVKKGTAKVEIRAIDPRRRGSDPGPFLAHQRQESQDRPTLSAPTRAPAARGETDTRLAARSAERPASPPLEQPPAIPTAAEPAEPSLARAQDQRERPWPAADRGPSLYLQVGAFGNPENAERLRERLAGQLGRAEVRVLAPAQSEAQLYKVRVGPLASDQDAERISEAIADLGIGRPRPIWN